VEDYGGSSGPAAGERAPDATIVKLPDKKIVSLEVLRGTQWTLLLLSGHKATPYTYQSLKNTGETIADKYSQSIIHLVMADTASLAHLNWDGSVLMDREHYLHEVRGVPLALFGASGLVCRLSR